MQTTSAVWKALWAAGASLEVRANIAGTVYTDIAAPVLRRALTQNGPGVGNVASASCTFSVRTAAAIPRAAEARLEMRLTDGGTASEWLPAGTFYISRRARDPIAGVWTLECYDALLRANAAWETDAEGWPRTMALTVELLAQRLGLELDARTHIESGAAYVVERPEVGATLRETLGYIAAAHGGNWIVTPEGRLRLVRLAQTGDEANVTAVLGRADGGVAAQITGLRCTGGEETALIGDDTGIVLEVPLAGALAEALADELLGLEWRSFELTGARIDPATELGDRVRYGDSAEGTLCVETATLGPAFRGDLSAPGSEELADEYPYLSPNAQALRALRTAVTALEEGSVSQVVTQYAQAASGAPAPVTGWSAAMPARAEGMEIWQRTLSIYNDGQTRLSEPVNISGADGKSATVLRIDSSRGTVFKDNNVATVLSVTVYYGDSIIESITDLRTAFGAGARLQWEWLRMDDDRYGVISADDSRLSDGGFRLTLGPADVDVKVTFRCALITDD